jgi:hypothetical protein
MWPSTATDHRCNAHDDGATISLFVVNPLGAHCTLPRNTNIAPSHAHSLSHCHSLTHPHHSQPPTTTKCTPSSFSYPPSLATTHHCPLRPLVIHSPTLTRNHPRPPTASHRHSLNHHHSQPPTTAHCAHSSFTHPPSLATTHDRPLHPIGIHSSLVRTTWTAPWVTTQRSLDWDHHQWTSPSPRQRACAFSPIHHNTLSMLESTIGHRWHVLARRQPQVHPSP